MKTLICAINLLAVSMIYGGDFSISSGPVGSAEKSISSKASTEVTSLVAIASYNSGEYDVINEMNRVRSILENANIETTTMSFVFVHADKASAARKILSDAIKKQGLHLTLTSEKTKAAEQDAAANP